MRQLLMMSMVVAIASVASAQTLLGTSFETTDGYNLSVLATASTSQNGWLQNGAGTDVTGSVSTNRAKSGTQSVLVDASNVNETYGFWYKPLSSGLITSTSVVRVSWSQYVEGAGSIFSIFGVPSYTQTGQFMNGIWFDNLTGKAQYFDLGQGQWISFAASTAGRDAWVDYAYNMNYATGLVTFEVNGVTMAETSGIAGRDSNFSDADFFTAYPGNDKANFDDLKVERLDQGVLRLKPNLFEFNGSLALRPVRVEVRPASGSPEVLTGTIGADGYVNVITTKRGLCDIAIKPLRHLQKTIIGVNITGNGYFTLPSENLSGDIDDDNVVSILDYSILSDFFDQLDTDADWLIVAGNGFAPVDADIDGDGTVSILDYSALSDNFDKNGDA